MKKSLLALLLLSVLSTAFMPGDDKKKWNVNEPGGTYKEIEITTSEGTWMNLDLSPDGKEIAFDMLGDIYTLPVTGGDAKLIAGGHAFEVQPRYSPDGKKISYTSDRSGADNIWTMNRDGSGAKQVTKENFRLLNNAVWMPDGQYLVARKHFSSTRSLGAGELWMYHITGGDGIQLTKKKNDQQDLGEPCISPDGKYVYYSEDMYPGGYFQYNKDPNNQIYIIRRYEFAKGETEEIAGGGGGAVRPELSNDGKWLAFVKRVRDKSVLYVRNLETGEERPVYDKLSKDQQEAWAIFGVYSNFSWTPDNKHIIIWAQGKLWKVDVAACTAVNIPFTAKSKHRVYDALRFQQQVSPEKFTARTIRHAITSPDGKTLVFNAAGYLWKKDLPSGSPVRLTNTPAFEFEPSFSPNGAEIVYVTWDDEQMGAIYKMGLKDKKAVKLSTEKGIYRNPSYSSDGKKIVFLKEEGNEHQGYTHSVKPGIYWMEAAGGKMNFVSKEGASPRFLNNGRIFFQSREGKDKAYKSMNTDGNEVQTHFTSTYANEVVPSPDNKWVAFRELFKVYIAPFPVTGKTMDLNAKTGAIPVSQVARDAGSNLHWTGDSKKVCWTYGNEYFANDINKRFTFLDGSPDSIPPIDTAGISIGLELNTDIPKGLLALKGARIITMEGDKVIENGIIVIKDNRIEAIGAAAEVAVPPGAKVIDVAGKTIMPGIVDVHAHLGTFRQGLSPQKQWSYYASLAYGITTTHDPSSNSEMVFSQSEMVKAGHMAGPRIYSTGTILYGADGDFKAVINNIDDARSAVRRTKAYGAFSVKSYNQPRREQRQQVIQASREQGIMVVPEGGSFFFHNLSMILDGHTTIEHNVPVATVYNDVIQLWGASKTAYTPTLIVAYGAMNGEYYWYQKTDVWANKRLLNFTPRGVIDQRARQRTMVPDDEYEFGHIQVARSCKKLSDAGVKVNVGSHGQIQGIGAHWELWMFAQGGMSNMQALRCATLNGAWSIGMDKEIGSLEKGKMADLVVLDKNPLEDIRNTEFVKYTMVNGRLFDAETMNEIGNYDKKRTKFWWETSNYNASFPWHEGTGGHGHGDED